MYKNKYLFSKPVLYGLFFILFCWAVFFLVLSKITPNYLELSFFNKFINLLPLIVIFGLISFIGGMITSKYSKKNKLINLILLGIISSTIILMYRLSVENINYYQVSHQFSELKKRDLGWVIETYQKNHTISLKNIFFNYPKTLISQMILISTGGYLFIFLQNFYDKKNK